MFASSQDEILQKGTPIVEPAVIFKLRKPMSNKDLRKERGPIQLLTHQAYCVGVGCKQYKKGESLPLP